jgi:hypothetical protein
MKNIVKFAALASICPVLALQPPVFEVVSPTYSDSIVESPLDWSPLNLKELSVPRFDPNLGTLRTVSLKFDFSGNASVSVENLDNSPRSVEMDIQIKSSLKKEDNSVLTTSTTLFDLANCQLGAFDGVSDFLGVSSFSNPNIPFGATSFDLFLQSGIDDLSYFIGNQDIVLKAETKSLIYGSYPDNVNVRVFAKGSANIFVVYSYLAAPCESKGTATLGYWKNHPSDWPVDSLILGNITYNKQQLLNILKKSVRGDKTIALAHQLIAAKLNVHPSRCNESECILDEIAAADAFLSIYPVCSNFRGSTGLITVLDDYNNGKLCAPHRD